MASEINYTLGSGYYRSGNGPDKFLRIWMDQNGSAFKDRSPDDPRFKIILSVGDSMLQYEWLNGEGFQLINLAGNLGHVHQLLGMQEPIKDHAYCGWSITFLTLALLAYQNETDFIFLEQDCLAFGPWVEQMYADMGDGDMVFGGKMKGPPYMPCSQGLVLVRHRFIPTLVMAFLSLGSDSNKAMLPEHKFQHIATRYGIKKIRHLSFGCDRERPIPYDAKVFYAQKLTLAELGELRSRNLIA